MSILRHIARSAARVFFSRRTVQLLAFDTKKIPVRVRTILSQRRVQPLSDQLHLGCGNRRVSGWLNVDIRKSDYNLDISCGKLPWKTSSFKVIVAQHLMEHLELKVEVIPLLKELRRVATPTAELWIVTPDLERIINSYMTTQCVDLIRDRQSRFPGFTIEGPPQQMLNVCFHQNGEHKNLFDFELLSWVLRQGGWECSKRTREQEFLNRFPGFPSRGDSHSSLWVVSKK